MANLLSKFALLRQLFCLCFAFDGKHCATPPLGLYQSPCICLVKQCAYCWCLLGTGVYWSPVLNGTNTVAGQSSTTLYLIPSYQQSLARQYVHSWTNLAYQTCTCITHMSTHPLQFYSRGQALCAALDTHTCTMYMYCMVLSVLTVLVIFSVTHYGPLCFRLFFELSVHCVFDHIFPNRSYALFKITVQREIFDGENFPKNSNFPLK